ncbi:MAG: hypothetical protein IKR63_05540 [Alloprevotella sp.]|nr:hypothetical protein [Alloprevotella sp.]
MKDEEEEKIKETRERYQGCFGCLGCGVVLGILLAATGTAFGLSGDTCAIFFIAALVCAAGLGILLADLDPSKGRDIP